MRIRIEGIDDNTLIKYIKTLCPKSTEKEIEEKIKRAREDWLQFVEVKNERLYIKNR